MFKKLLSNLPFNPSLIGQVSFYAVRLHKESVVRRSGLILIVLAMMLQIFAVASPPEPSLASSSSDIITGGFTTKDSGAQLCEKNTQKFKQILSYFNIDCDDLRKSTKVSIEPNDHNKRLYSMGRLAYGTAGETPINVPNVGTFYLRHFYSLNHNRAYEALKVTTDDGSIVYIVLDCGNLVFIGIPKPKPKDVCTNIGGVQTKPEECDVCPLNVGIQTDKSQCDLCPNLPGVQPVAKCDVCPNVSGTQSTAQECDVCPAVPGTQLTSKECDVCPEIAGVQSNTSQCKPCEQSQTRDDLTACLEYRKTASNTTQQIVDANGTTAKGGDVIEYTLLTTNQGKVTIKNYTVNENISDVLDYADVVDLQGGTKNQDNIVSWPAKEIKAGQTLTQKFTVRIKSPIPNTPVSSSDAGHFDMTMTNVYGNAVSIKLPPSVVKATETVVTQLPNTGPGTSLVIGFSITTIAAYFFARTRLFAKELDIVRSDYAAGA